LARIERIAGLLDKATHEHSRKYVEDGMWGIFASGGQRDYNRSKVRFIHEQLCARGVKGVSLRTLKRPTVCEVGFCAGLSAMLFLESLPRARYIGWDLGEIGWTESNIELMRRAYGERFINVLVLGHAHATVPAYQQDHPELKCDGARPSVEPTRSAASADSAFALDRPVTYIDGAKGYNQHLLNLLDMRNMSVPRATLLLFDEATSEACVNGTLRQGEPTCDGPSGKRGLGIHGSARAYNKASRAGFIRVKGCAKTPYQNESLWRMDTLCAGEYSM